MPTGRFPSSVTLQTSSLRRLRRYLISIDEVATRISLNRYSGFRTSDGQIWSQWFWNIVHEYCSSSSRRISWPVTLEKHVSFFIFIFVSVPCPNCGLNIFFNIFLHDATSKDPSSFAMPPRSFMKAQLTLGSTSAQFHIIIGTRSFTLDDSSIAAGSKCYKVSGYSGLNCSVTCDIIRYACTLVQLLLLWSCQVAANHDVATGYFSDQWHHRV